MLVLCTGYPDSGAILHLHILRGTSAGDSGNDEYADRFRSL
jgi:hypothetical protein